MDPCQPRLETRNEILRCQSRNFHERPQDCFIALVSKSSHVHFIAVFAAEHRPQLRGLQPSGLPDSLSVFSFWKLSYCDFLDQQRHKSSEITPIATYNLPCFWVISGRNGTWNGNFGHILIKYQCNVAWSYLSNETFELEANFGPQLTFIPWWNFRTRLLVTRPEY